jgi:hypothetical protein
MGLKSLIGAAIAATFVLGATACTGTADMGKSPEVVGERAEIVAQKRDWLRNYDENCEVCFKAFELCGKGARDQAEIDACQTALDACVRGGLIKDDGNDNGGEDADGGAAVGDGNNGNDNGGNGNGDVGDGNGNGNDGDEEDAGVDDGDNAGDGDGDVNAGDGDANAGDGDANAGDGDVNDGDNNDGDDGDVNDGDNNDGDNNDGDNNDGDNNDGDADSDEASDEASDPNNDGDADGRPGDAVKGNLIEDVKACLDTGAACLEADGADTGDCVDALRECVKSALDDAFESVCSTQHRQCREHNASSEETNSVEDLCNEGVDAVVD